MLPTELSEPRLMPAGVVPPPGPAPPKPPPVATEVLTPLTEGDDPLLDELELEELEELELEELLLEELALAVVPDGAEVLGDALALAVFRVAVAALRVSLRWRSDFVTCGFGPAWPMAVRKSAQLASRTAMPHPTVPSTRIRRRSNFLVMDISQIRLPPRAAIGFNKGLAPGSGRAKVRNKWNDCLPPRRDVRGRSARSAWWPSCQGLGPNKCTARMCFDIKQSRSTP
jgi:hypothetical protein